MRACEVGMRLSPEILTCHVHRPLAITGSDASGPTRMSETKKNRIEHTNGKKQTHILLASGCVVISGDACQKNEMECWTKSS